MPERDSLFQFFREISGLGAAKRTASAMGKRIDAPGIVVWARRQGVFKREKIPT
jgi:hypothetical protein